MFFILKVWKEACPGKEINGNNDTAVLANLSKKRSEVKMNTYNRRKMSAEKMLKTMRLWNINYLAKVALLNSLSIPSSRKNSNTSLFSLM